MGKADPSCIGRKRQVAKLQEMQYITADIDREALVAGSYQNETIYCLGQIETLRVDTADCVCTALLR